VAVGVQGLRQVRGCAAGCGWVCWCSPEQPVSRGGAAALRSGKEALDEGVQGRNAGALPFGRGSHAGRQQPTSSVFASACIWHATMHSIGPHDRCRCASYCLYTTLTARRHGSQAEHVCVVLVAVPCCGQLQERPMQRNECCACCGLAQALHPCSTARHAAGVCGVWVVVMVGRGGHGTRSRDEERGAQP
jgi:hypothetical protein